MYQVSNAFIEAMKSPVQEHRLTGTIGSISFSEANVVDGSFSISNQSTDTYDVVLGSCYVGQLTAEFVGINIEWGKWINKTITPTFALNLGGNTWESVPLGIFKVKEAKHTDHGVQVTAYDNMIKFDKKFRKSHYMNLSGMTNIIDQLCLDAGVVFGMTHAQIEELPNGDRTGINIYGSTGKKAEFANDITTLRDLLFWVAQTLGCFATINRAGQLEFRQYTQDVVDNISNVHRIEGATFADYITHYVGIYVENLDDNTEDYYGYDVTALQQELTETMGEITQDQEDITDLEADRADWVQKLANHECTQQEYDAAIAEIDAQEKALTKEINQLSKRAEWLTNAIAQSADDGSDMVLGANPLVMAKNLTTRDAQRREILGALNAISYTPFQAVVLCGCIYDLGDVIQFSGGLYNSDTDSFGCVMSYTYTHNGGTELEGFGVDPSVVVIRNKTQKSTDRASKNAVNAKESFNGFSDPQDEFPSGGKDGDIYIKRKVERTPKITIVNNDKYWTNGFFTPHDDMYKVHAVIVDRDTGKYSVSAYGNAYVDHPGSNLCEGTPIVELHGFTKIGTYRFHVKANYTADYDGAHWGSNLGIAVLLNDTDVPTTTNPGSFSPILLPVGIALNVNLVQNTYYEYTCDFEISQRIFEQIQNGIIYMYFPRLRCIENWNLSRFLRYNMQDFYIEYLDDGEPWYEEEEYIEDVYTYIKDDEESGQGQDTGRWVKIDYLSGADTSSWSGLNVDYKKILSLKDYVMRAWYKADPPQIERDFSQFCVRYTGRPDTGITISYHGASGWEGQELKVSDEGIYAIKCGGTRTSGVDYVAYKIEGLVSGARYYFNFAANIGNSATFGDDFTKGLGLIFNASGSINSNDWSGDPHTFDDSTLYESFYRNTGKRYYDFDFVATASTMYMIVTVADINEGITTVLNLTEFVVSQEERKYIRELYLYDFHVNEWLKYKPFGTKDDGSAEGVTHLSELDDVSFDGLQNGQILEYDSDLDKWINANKPDYVHDVEVDDTSVVDQYGVAHIDTMTGAGASSAGAKGLVPAPASGDNEKFLAGDGTWKAAPSGGTSAISDLTDVNVDEETLTDGQVLKWDDTEGEWVNADESGGSQAIELTKAQYDALPSADKNDPNKVYYVTDYPTPSGIDLDDIDDVDLSSPTDGQVLKYDGTNQKWINANESGGGTPSMSDWGWGVLHKTIEWSGGFASDAYSLVSYIEYVKPSSMIGKMVIVQGVHVYGSTDGTTFNDTLDFDLHYVYNRTNQSDEEVVYIGGLMHNHSSVTYTHVKFSANVIYI